MSELNKNTVIEELSECLDIPESAYDKAEARYKDLGEWFSRAEAHCARFNPHICPQGSFRLGTVINADEFDLDFGCRLRQGITKGTHTQEQLKQLVRRDLEEYRQARGIEQELEEKSRCWRLKYNDQLAFHMDGVPSIPEEEQGRVLLEGAMVRYGIDRSLAEHLTRHAGAITDNRLPNYTLISQTWKISNSEGYAQWFESRMKLASDLMQRRAREARAGNVDELPARKWKSPLQRSIQIMKCHRDRMFEDNAESKPISIILTTLAAEAYQGEQEVSDALEGILARMGTSVRSELPRVPNPVNPSEDFADKWYDAAYRHLDLEGSFWSWLKQAQIDFDIIRQSRDPEFISDQAVTKFGATLTAAAIRGKYAGIALSGSTTPRVHTISETPPKPWLRE
jgi:hypothetical protein